MPILTENKGVGDTGKSEVSFVKCVFLLWKSALVMRCFLFFILSEKVTDRKRTSLLLRRFSWNGWNRKLQVCFRAAKEPKKRKGFRTLTEQLLQQKLIPPTFHYFLDSLSLKP